MAEPTSTESTKRVHKYVEELDVAEKELRKFWERGRRVVKKYLDEAEATDADRYNVFWSNVGVLKSALYAVPPRPVVKREFDDYQDDVARVASIMMERLLSQGFDDPESDSNKAFSGIVEDRLVPGLGQIWLRYEPVIESREIAPGVPVETITDEYVHTDYVYWEDFLWSPARNWDEVRWVARRVWLTKKEFVARFGEQYSGIVSFSKKTPATKNTDKITPDLGVAKTEVFEIWSRTTKTVCWVSKSCEYELDYKEDPLNLNGFFPCPPPLLATHTTNSLVPKADYLMVQTQYRRLDILSARIGMLESAIQASGVYDKTNMELAQIINKVGNKMIPVDNWAMFAEKGGMKGVVDWFPIEMVVVSLDKLRELFRDALVQLYELTGISDIMRGNTNPRETLGAQQLKSQYSSVRLQYLQGEVANFVQNGLRIKAEIIANHFQPETMIRNSLIELTPDAEIAPQAVEYIKKEWNLCYRVRVFADTLSIPDYTAERNGRIEFITAAGQYVSQITQLLAAAPETAPFFMQILQWAVASFRSAQTIEGVFDKAIFALQEKLKQPKSPPPPDPALLKVQAEIQQSQKEAEIKVWEAQQLAQIEQGKAMGEQQRESAKNAVEVEAVRKETAADVQATIVKALADVSATRMKTQAQIEQSRAKNAAAIAAQRAKARAGNGQSKGR